MLARRHVAGEARLKCQGHCKRAVVRSPVAEMSCANVLLRGYSIALQKLQQRHGVHARLRCRSTLPVHALIRPESEVYPQIKERKHYAGFGNLLESRRVAPRVPCKPALRLPTNIRCPGLGLTPRIKFHSPPARAPSKPASAPRTVEPSDQAKSSASKTETRDPLFGAEPQIPSPHNNAEGRGTTFSADLTPPLSSSAQTLSNSDPLELLASRNLQSFASGCQKPSESQSPKASGSLLGAVALITGTSVGAGILALPSISAPAGFIPATSIMLGCWGFLVGEALLLAEVNVELLKRVAGEKNRASDVLSLRTMAQKTLGSAGGTAATLAYVFLTYALLVRRTDPPALGKRCHNYLVYLHLSCVVDCDLCFGEHVRTEYNASRPLKCFIGHELLAKGRLCER